MRRFLSLFVQDLAVVSRNALMWVVAGALITILHYGTISEQNLNLVTMAIIGLF